MKNTLVCLAMLKVQIDEQKGVYVDYFVPYLLQIIKQQFHLDNQNTKLSLVYIQNSIESMYGLKLPIDSIELIIKRIVKTHRTVLKRENHKYYIISVENIPNQDENFVAAERGISAVCNALVQFSQDKPLPLQNIEEAFEAILEFLSEFSIEALSNIQGNSALPELSHRNNKRIVLTALFVQHLSKNDTENYNNFSNIVKGYMLTNVLLWLDTTERSAKIDTCFYIDTPLVLSCLGFNGETSKKSIKELFALILKLSGKLCVFSHTIEEIHNVLTYHGSQSSTFFNTRMPILSTSDIVIIQEDLEEILEKEKIKIEQTPTVAKFENENNIGGRCSAITNFMATNLLWLKMPMESPDLPMQTVIAQSYSLLDNPELWKKFLQKADQLQQNGNITKEEIQYLRGSERIVQDIVSEATLGDLNDLENQQTVSAICEEAKKQIIKDAMDRAAIAEEKLSRAEKMVRTLSTYIAHAFTIISYVLLGLFLLILHYFFQEHALSINIFATIILSITGVFTYKKLHQFYKNRIFNLLTI